MPTSFSWIFHSAATWRRLWRSGVFNCRLFHGIGNGWFIPHSLHPTGQISTNKNFNLVHDSRQTRRSILRLFPSASVSVIWRDFFFSFLSFLLVAVFLLIFFSFSFYLVSLSWWLALLVIKGPNFYQVYAPADFISLFSPPPPFPSATSSQRNWVTFPFILIQLICNKF